MDLRGLIVLIITLGIVAMLVIGIIGAAFWGKTLTGAAVDSLSTVLGMLIGVVSSYVAGAFNHGKSPFMGEARPTTAKPSLLPTALPVPPSPEPTGKGPPDAQTDSTPSTDTDSK